MKRLFTSHKTSFKKKRSFYVTGFHPHVFGNLRSFQTLQFYRKEQAFGSSCTIHSKNLLRMILLNNHVLQSDVRYCPLYWFPDFFSFRNIRIIFCELLLHVLPKSVMSIVAKSLPRVNIKRLNIHCGTFVTIFKNADGTA